MRGKPRLSQSQGPGVCEEGQPGYRKVPCMLEERKQHSRVGKGEAIRKVSKNTTYHREIHQTPYEAFLLKKYEIRI